MFKHLLFILFIVLSPNLWAQYYDTLPKGVRLLSTRYIQSEVSSSFNHSENETPFTFEINTDIENLEALNNEVINEAIGLFKEYPEAYSQLSLGSHRIDASAQVNVDVYAFGYGITNRTTAYLGVPIYRANVAMSYKQTKPNSNEEVAASLQKLYGNDEAQSLGNIMEQFYAIDDEVIQSAIVNTLGYEELGDWSGQGLGDIELGVMHNFKRESNYGLMATTGLVLPTGRIDDPDIIQDIGFGDGQLDAFLELGGGYRLRDNTYFNAWTRYTYQFATDKTLRVPYSEETTLSNEKDEFNEKLGNKIDAGVELEIALTDWLEIRPAYLYHFTEAARYESSNARANKILAANSEAQSRSIRVLSELSTVKLFKQKKFFLPAQMHFTVQRMMNGRNTARVDRVEFDFRLFF